VTDLAAGTYDVRVKATSSSFASGYVNVTILSKKSGNNDDDDQGENKENVNKPMLQNITVKQTNATWKINVPYDDFLQLLLGDDIVDRANYTVEDGSTIITLLDSYVKTLPEGTNTFHAEFKEGYTVLTLAVGTPQSEGGSNLWLIIVVAMAVSFCIALAVILRRSRTTTV
jgi:hypothetical protein